MLRIVTDGAADISPEWQKLFDIQVLPINIHFGEKTYLQNVDLDTEGFYKLVDETRRIPKTSQPAPHQFVEFYKKIAREGDTILSVHVTSKLSGTFDSAIAAARELAGAYKIVPFDSLCGSAGIAMLCREARLAEQAGQGIEQIVKKLEDLREKIDIFLALDTLQYARMSGRVGTLQAAMASVLNVKPIVKLSKGVLNMSEKVRTRGASLERLITLVKEKVGESPVCMAVVHARDPKAGQALLERVRETINVKELYLTDLSISIAANLGPGTVGLVFYPVE